MTTKNATIQIRVTVDEKRTMHRLAKKSGLSLSAWMRRVLLSAAALLLIACVHAPTAPTAAAPTVGPLRLGLAGQSNSIYLRPFLAERATVSAFYGEVTTIAPCWDVTGSCWASLRPSLHQPLDAVIWSQGESDIMAQSPDYGGTPTPGVYGRALTNLIGRIRQENSNPALLIVVMQKGPWAADRAGVTVEAETLAWVRQDAHALYIETRDLAWRPDAIHMTDQGYRDVTARLTAQIQAKVRS